MAERLSPGDYIANIKAQVPQLASGIKDLAKAELVPSAKHAGIGGGLFGGAGVLVVAALRALLLALGFACAEFYYHVAHREVITSFALGFVTMGVLALIAAAIVTAFGHGQVKQVKAPTATIEEAKASLSAIGASVQAGVQDAHEIASRGDRPATGPGAWLAKRADSAVAKTAVVDDKPNAA